MLKAKKAICTELIPNLLQLQENSHENGNWEFSDAYFTPNINAKFTHGICTECVKRLYPTLKP